MRIREVRELQEQYGVSYYQELIDSGIAWKMEGSIGRKAMDYLRSGACFLPLKTYYDYWGNEVPSRSSVRSGSTGSLSLSKDFWSDESRYSNYFDVEFEMYND